MLRPIKFRLWDKERKCFVADSEYVIFPNKEVLSESETRPVVYQQFSGCGDAYGKPIFEGDYLKVSGEVIRIIGEGAILGPVVFQSGCFGIPRKKFRAYDSAFTTLNDLSFDQCEVVGNVFENPELAK